MNFNRHCLKRKDTNLTGWPLVMLFIYIFILISSHPLEPNPLLNFLSWDLFRFYYSLPVTLHLPLEKNTNQSCKLVHIQMWLFVLINGMNFRSSKIYQMLYSGKQQFGYHIHHKILLWRKEIVFFFKYVHVSVILLKKYWKCI